MQLYNKIGEDYDTTRQADPYILSSMIKWLNIKSGSKYIDIACGSGNYIVELAKTNIELYGIEESTLMISNARAKTTNYSFATLANKEELEAGCEKLAQDIKTNIIKQVIKQYENVHGDYLLVIAKK